MKDRNITFTRMLFALGLLALLPGAQAVVPPPDGGYPGGNTAEGQAALLSLTTGGFNTAVGFFALRSNTLGQFNTAIGAGALLANVGDPGTSNGIQNTATGAGALLSNTTGEDNTANGAFALVSNTTGDSNTATGAFALQKNTTGGFNIAMGLGALLSNTTGFENTAVGTNALVFNTEGNFNTAIGDVALRNNTTGGGNTAVGHDALFANTTGANNTAIGFQALSNSTGFNNVALGDGAGGGVVDANNVICIGHAGANVNNSCFIENIRGAVVAPDAAPVLIDSAGKLGTTSGSSRRFKTEIKPMHSASETILALTPVTFHYKSDRTRTPQFGLIAEEVAEVNPDLVVHDKNGELLTVRYDAVNAMLLNEFLKEHRKGEEQDRAISQLKSALAQQQKTFESKLAQQERQIAALMANVQRLAADIELKKAESQTVAEK